MDWNQFGDFIDPDPDTSNVDLDPYTINADPNRCFNTFFMRLSPFFTFFPKKILHFPFIHPASICHPPPQKTPIVFCIIYTPEPLIICGLPGCNVHRVVGEFTDSNHIHDGVLAGSRQITVQTINLMHADGYILCIW